MLRCSPQGTLVQCVFSAGNVGCYRLRRLYRLQTHSGGEILDTNFRNDKGRLCVLYLLPGCLCYHPSEGISWLALGALLLLASILRKTEQLRLAAR